jgi:hypothetical protein
MKCYPSELLLSDLDAPKIEEAVSNFLDDLC